VKIKRYEKKGKEEANAHTISDSGMFDFRVLPAAYGM
jgi:hypothetical protein